MARRLCERRLLQAGAVVTSFVDSAAALHALAAASPHICLVDVHLEHETGLRAAANLRTAGFRGMLAFLTATPELVDGKAAALLRADSILSKPPELSALVRLLETARNQPTLEFARTRRA